MGPAVSADYARASSGLTAVTTPFFLIPSTVMAEFEGSSAISKLYGPCAVYQPCARPSFRAHRHSCGYHAAPAAGGFHVASSSRQGPRLSPFLRLPRRCHESEMTLKTTRFHRLPRGFNNPRPPNLDPFIAAYWTGHLLGHMIDQAVSPSYKTPTAPNITGAQGRSP